MTRGSGVVVRVGLAQAGIGAVIVLMTSTLNRVMIVELGLPAVVPGALVALHFAVQLVLRPRLGFASDADGRRVPWVRRGMALLAIAGTTCAAATALAVTSPVLGLLLAIVAFAALGAGVSAAGTPLLALLAESVPAERRARAAAAVWLMMIAGFVLTTVVASRLLVPFSFGRLVGVVALVGAVAFAVSSLAVQGLDAARAPVAASATPDSSSSFRSAIAEVWHEPAARLFALFVFCSMLAYSAQDLILEPYGGLVFHLTPAESTAVSGMHQGGMLLGMLIAALLAARGGRLRTWAAGGCVGSAVGFVMLVLAPGVGTAAALRLAVLVLGLANGAFAVGAVGSMMAFSVAANGAHAGVRMGVFGAAQAIAYACGGFLGAAGSDVARWLLGSVERGYSVVFGAEAVAFVVAAALAWRAAAPVAAREAVQRGPAADVLLAQVG